MTIYNVLLANTDGGGIGLTSHLVGAAGMPEYYSWRRDAVLAATPTFDDIWSNAVAIAVNKAASRSWELTSTDDTQRLLSRWQRMLRLFGGEGFKAAMAKLARQFYLCNNGAFIRLHRETPARASRIVALSVLDSETVVRTGNPKLPFYIHTTGEYLSNSDVINIVDNPSPKADLFGLGQCAADRCFKTILLVTAMNTYVREKISGNRQLAIHIVSGITADQLSSALADSETEAEFKSYVYYRGTTIIPRLREGDVSVATIPLAELPDGFNAELLTKQANVIFANALGVPVQELVPLSGQAFGTGTQSVVLQEAAEGRSYFFEAVEEQLNLHVLPGGLTFGWYSRSVQDELLQAQVAKVRAETRAVRITSGELTVDMAQQIATDEGDLNPAYLPLPDLVATSVLDDDENVTSAGISEAPIAV